MNNIKDDGRVMRVREVRAILLVNDEVRNGGDGRHLTPCSSIHSTAGA